MNEEAQRMPANPSPGAENVSIGPLLASDLDIADRVLRLAFGTFLGLDDPGSFLGDADFLRTRSKTECVRQLAAKLDGELIGSVSVVDWGSVGFFGPLSVHPDHWERKVGQRLVAAAVAQLDQWGTKHAGLYTFAHSAKHVALYQKFGFRPRCLTAIMSRPITGPPLGEAAARTVRFSEARPEGRAALLAELGALVNAMFEGLVLEGEIQAVADQALGETIAIGTEDRLEGMAVCHVGPGTEAGGGVCYLKVGGVRPGPSPRPWLTRLLDACAELGRSRGASRLIVGTNTAREDAYEALLAGGFRAEQQGVAMLRPNQPGPNRPGVHLFDDWR